MRPSSIGGDVRAGRPEPEIHTTAPPPRSPRCPPGAARAGGAARGVGGVDAPARRQGGIGGPTTTTTTIGFGFAHHLQRNCLQVGTGSYTAPAPVVAHAAALSRRAVSAARHGVARARTASCRSVRVISPHSFLYGSFYLGEGHRRAGKNVLPFFVVPENQDFAHTRSGKT